MIEVTVPGGMLQRIRDYARATIDGYRRGKFPDSARLSSRGADKDERLWRRAKLAEVGVAVWADLDPEVAVKWTLGEDMDGIDLVIGRTTADVKNTATGFLFWPANKSYPVNRLLSKRFHVFVATKTPNPPQVELHGWFARKDFLQCREVAGSGHMLDEHTQFVEHSRLHRMGTFPDRHEDLREHYCWCGEWGSFGVGVFPKQGKLGLHYCRKHAAAGGFKWR